MKILHIIHALQKAAGTSFFCVELCQHLKASGNDVLIVCQGADEYPSKSVIVSKIGDFKEIQFVPDVVHIHGLWDFFMHQAMLWCREKHFPYIISLHGCLMPYALSCSVWKKRLALYLYLKFDLKNARRLHVTSALEKATADQQGLGVESVIVPLGCDIPVLSDKKGRRVRMALFLSRISPEKGLFNLLRAWDMVDTAGWQLVIAGPDWRGHLSEVSAFVKERGMENVRFVGPAYAKDKEMLYREADFFVLPSLTENFSAVVAEAMSYGLPVVTTKGTPWAELETERCGWWVDLGVDPMQRVLDVVLNLTDGKREDMGKRGRTLIEREYSWQIVANKMQSVYAKSLDAIHG